MACNLTRGFALGCRDNVGGINKIYIGNFDGANAVPVTTAAGEVTAVASSGGDLYTYDFPMGNASFSETVAQSRANGTIFYEPTVTLKLHKHCAALRNELVLLGQARTIIFVELNHTDGTNNTVYALGLTNGMMLETSNNQSGTAFGDYTGLELSFKGMEQAPAYVCDNTMASYAVTLTSGAFGQC
jgi:hypothetical protein